MEKIIIVGAGVAGISAAMQLCDSGCDVEIFEQKMQVGGRITAIHDLASGDTIDNGQHLLTGAYTRFLEILERLGTSEGVTAQKIVKKFHSFRNRGILLSRLQYCRVAWVCLQVFCQ